MENNCAWNGLDEPIRELLRIRDKMSHMDSTKSSASADYNDFGLLP
jgi:hypothetical protein